MKNTKEKKNEEIISKLGEKLRKRQLENWGKKRKGKENF